MSVVVSDTSPIRALFFLDQMDLFPALFGELTVPPSVVAELLNPRGSGPLVDARSFEFISIREPTQRDRVRQWMQFLDAGEAEAIALAEEVAASTLLMDERDGRAAATNAGFDVIGTLGILVRAKKQKLIETVGPSIERLQNELGFFVSDQLRDEVLAECQE